jgi:D-alanyl-D-alanine carboxypeptidase
MTEPRSSFGAAASRAFHAAHAEARRRGRDSVGAEHLLLALADERDTACWRFLNSAGLSREVLDDALDRESTRSLAYAKVAPLGAGVVASPAQHRGPVRLGASARSAIQAGMKASARGHRPRRAEDLLIGILSARLGTVPRALAIAGVDRESLLSALDEHVAPGVAE